MATQDPFERLTDLMERQICLELHFRRVPQGTIAKILQKNKKWVNDLLKDMQDLEERR
jgi:hypothetical protein